MCTGRVDLAFVLRAYQGGADGVIIGGCWPGECHYVTEGNYDALNLMHLCKKVLEYKGIDPERLRIEWISASEGTRFAEIMNDFTEKLRLALAGAQSPREAAREITKRLTSIARARSFITWKNRKALVADLDEDPTGSRVEHFTGDGVVAGNAVLADVDEVLEDPSGVAAHAIPPVACHQPT